MKKYYERQIIQFQLLIKKKMIKLSYIIAGTVGTILVVPPLRNRFDQKIWKHVRNYNTTLGQYNKFQTQQQFYQFLGNVGNGFVTFFSD